MTDVSERGVAQAATEQSERVLIVDSDPQLGDDTASALLGVGLRASAITSASEAIDVATRLRPTVLIADIDLGVELGGLRLAEAIRRRWGASVIVMSPRTDDATVRAIAAASPGAALYKPFYSRQLELTVRLLIAQRHALSPPQPAIADRPHTPDRERADLEGTLRRIAVEISRVGFAVATPVKTHHHELLRTLRPRELEVVMLMLQHHRVPAIARLLSIRPNTVRNHLKRVFKRLGVRSQEDLMQSLKVEDTTAAT